MEGFKPNITDDIIKLLNEIAVPVKEWLSQGWDYTTRLLLPGAHTAERLQEHANINIR